MEYIGLIDGSVIKQKRGLKVEKGDEIISELGRINGAKTHVAVGPVSASPSTTTQATIRSGLSITAPKATLSA